LSDPSVQGIVVNSRDVTERMEAEEALRNSEERLRFAVDAARLGSWDLDLVTGSARRSLRHDQIFGYEELLPEWNYDLFLKHVHPEDRSFVRQRFDAASRTGSDWEFECRIFRADGPLRWIWARGAPYPDEHGRPVRLFGGVIDITERKRAQEELRESEERYRAVVEQTGECLFLFDARTKRILETNSAFRKLFGYTADELKEMKIYDIVEDDPKNIDANILRNLERKHLEVGERRYRRKDGSLVDVEVSGNIISYGGREEVVCGIARDITERKRAKEKLRSVREEERRRIARDLHDDVLSDLVYALQGIQINQEVYGAEDLEEAAESLRRSVEGLRAAIFEMRLQESLEQSFSSSLWSLVELNRRMARGRCEVELEMGEGFPSNLPERQGREFVRVLQEATNNARRHSGARHIKIALGREGDHLWAEVSDDGRGFDVARSLGGVGSSSMRQRAARLGGELEVQSALGRGTRVRFEVPIARMLETTEDAGVLSDDV
nr:PAS domain S-box protein [Actinomycetota bacterium]